MYDNEQFKRFKNYNKGEVIMMSPKERDLLLKIKRLADSGALGEKENARKILDRKLKELGIKEEELAYEGLVVVSFSLESLTGVLKQLLIQTVYSVLDEYEYKNGGSVEKDGKYFFELTREHAVLATYKWEIVKKKFLEEEQIFLEAFCKKNDLYLSFKEPSIVKPNDASYEHTKRVLDMAELIYKANINLALKE